LRKSRRRTDDEDEEEAEEEEMSRADKVPALKNVVKMLAQRDMLPAIVFIFSRAGCDEAARMSTGVGLVSAEERASILAAVEELRSISKGI
jgi:ATP-dependent RNA helicase HelY